MENAPPAISVQDDGRSSKRGRIMGKLFGRDRKASNDDQLGRSLNDFLHGSADKIPGTQRPPVLTKLDTTNAPRYPNALSVPDTSPRQPTARQSSRGPGRRDKKRLIVRFAESPPEIVGVGGEECDVPVQEIGKQKKLRHAGSAATAAASLRGQGAGDGHSRMVGETRKDDDFAPRPLRRTQTGYSSVSLAPEPDVPAAKSVSTNFLASPAVLHDEKRKSFLEIHQAQMRQAEGLAFANAVRSNSSSSQKRDDPGPPPLDRPEDTCPPPTHAVRPASPPIQTQKPPREGSPTSLYSSSPSPVQRRASTRQDSRRAMDFDSLKRSLSLHDVVIAAGDEAMDTFVARTRHLFELFRLHSETVRPLISTPPEQLVRAGLWWFLRGRMSLEAAIRERPASPRAQQQNESAKQQAYADLAKGYWLSEEAVLQVLQDSGGSLDADVEEARKSIKSNLRKLVISMKRNGFLPPEEAFLPQIIDKSIWVEYPTLSRDIVALLWSTASTALSQMETPSSGLSLLDTLPMGDSASTFCFGRVQADVFLMEQGIESQRLYLPCLVSITRPPTQSNLVFVLASQNGTVQLRIQEKRNPGPTWDDVRWRSESCSFEVKLPRGFIIVAQFAQPDFKMLRNMYDYNANVQTTLYPRKDEQRAFSSTLKAFQYLDNDPQARQFPRESIRSCEIALFERIMQEGAATGLRSYHRGYRLAIVTGPRTKTISGINQVFLPQAPVRFGFLRSEQNAPALSLKFENGRQKGSMVLSFNDDKERLRMHNLLTGMTVDHDESTYCDVPLQSLRFADRLGDSTSFMAISALSWERARVINQDDGDDQAICVLSDKLRIVLEAKDGSITDRVNVAPGEFKIRLDAKTPTRLMVYRHMQADLTVAVAEAKIPRELVQALSRDTEQLQKGATIRTYAFPTVADLHQFERAVTGFKVLFDAVASAFNISRRRMVVPIHKKWEAGTTRIQVVQQDGVSQLLAFFEDFTHGECMSFTLKGTDVFEAFGKPGKAGVKFDDAKFPLPKSLADGADAQAAADAAFVCLDLPELPGEHDDISITFESEVDRDKLIQCLPAPVKVSKSIKR